MGFSAQQVQDALLSYVDKDGYEATSWSDWDYEITEGELEGIGHVEVIENVGGEGEGDHRHLVFHLTAADGDCQYFKLDGYYSSYGGTEWDSSDIYEVRPKQKTITVYEA
jgi:hypothetical protein